MTKRLIILQALLLAGMSCVFLLPKAKEAQPVGINLELPETLGEWDGQDASASQREKDTLGPETQFARKIYGNAFGDRLFVSIVLSGQDMNTSIHRPERCLPAQGLTIVDEHQVAVPMAPPDHGVLPLMRIHTMQPSRGGGNLYSLNYYWFVGCEDLTASHWTRTVIDIRDRIMHGQNQRWAYVTIAGMITDKQVKYGRSEKEMDQMIQDFARQLAPKIHKSSVKYN